MTPVALDYERQLSPKDSKPQQQWPTKKDNKDKRKLYQNETK